MRTTATYRVFSPDPAHRPLARSRQLLGEGRLTEAEAAYREAQETAPELKEAWSECFQVLRMQQRFDDARTLAEEAKGRFPGEAFALALGGAALVELGRVREGLSELEQAAQLDPDLGLVWHEAGYAAWRLGDRASALMALDRAFTLEPHGATLRLRGLILREGGRYPAAEVAFTGAAEAAEFPDQQHEAERQVAITRRYAAFPGRRPADLSAERRFFAETGTAILTVEDAGNLPSNEDLMRAFVDLAREEGWSFSHLLATDPWPGWQGLGERLEAALVEEFPAEQNAVVCAVARAAEAVAGPWRSAGAEIRSRNRGLTFVLSQSAEAEPADVAAALEGRSGVRIDLAAASEAARHPEGRLRDRQLFIHGE